MMNTEIHNDTLYARKNRLLDSPKPSHSHSETCHALTALARSHATIFSYALGFLTTVFLIAAARGDDWARFGGPNGNYTLASDESLRPAPPTELNRSVEKLGKDDTNAGLNLKARWTVPLRGGDDAALVVRGRVIVSEMDQDSDGKPRHRVSCWSATNGNSIWSHAFSENTYPSQDISQRYPVRPIATSCVENDRIVCVSYGGVVRCLDIEKGQLVWEHDLVSEFEASPMQFGAASSPWSDGERVVIASGGTQALLIAFDWRDGSVQWKSKSGEASYTSIVEMPIATKAPTSPRTHLVYAARDYVVGIHAKTGEELWRYEYPNAGLTNAVTPLVVGPGQLIVAGQGIGGTVRLEVTELQSSEALTNADAAKDAEQSSSNKTKLYSVIEQWRSNRFKPFYCNWVYLSSSQLIVGFADNTLQCVDAQSGERLWAKRGWTDSNVVAHRNRLLIARGDGGMAVATVDRTGLEVERVGIAVQDRVWVAPSVVGTQAIIRGRESLTCIEIRDLPSGTSMPTGVEITSMEAMYGGGSKK